jgi:hypothetical protein
MGRTCSMSGRSLKYVQHIGWKEWREETIWEILVICVRLILKLILNKWGGRVWAGFMWHRTGIIDRLLYTWFWTSGFYRRWNCFTVWIIVNFEKKTLLLGVSHYLIVHRL